MSQSEALRRYYAFHAGIYDATRWSFLFGRRRLIDEIAEAYAHAGASPPRHILEVGCGTGVNLLALGRRFPGARLVGMDGSPSMLRKARQRLHPIAERVSFLEGFYERPLGLRPAPDLICFSYCLSMINPGAEEVIAAAVAELAPGGMLAVVDFHASPVARFQRWMAMNHVRMEGHLIKALTTRMPTRHLRVTPAYAGLWQYFHFLGGSAVAGAPGRSTARSGVGA